MHTIIKKKIIKAFAVIRILLCYTYISEWLAAKRTELRSYWLNSMFKECHRTTRFGKIQWLLGTCHVSVGTRTVFGDYLTLTAWEKYEDQTFTPSIIIGDGCNFGLHNHISAINNITIGDNCLTGKWVTISDNNHGKTDFESLKVRPLERRLYSKGPVVIGKNVWIGDKATILAGVTIGDGAVIAANTVVTKDVPGYSVCAGNPGKIVKQNIN